VSQRSTYPLQLHSGGQACSLVAVRHVAKTGGVSVREWMLGIEHESRGHYYGPATWMKYRGRCDGRKRYLFCCHPKDERSAKDCRMVQLTRARSIVVNSLAASSKASSVPIKSLTMLEFHWPDSGLGRWGEPHTFLEMLPRMRPHSIPGCRVVVATVLRDPLTLYPSLQRHQYDAMREYGRETLQKRCGCNLTSCDMIGFIRAYPNFQAWRLTSPRWVYPALDVVGHEPVYAAASRLLTYVDVVGVVERLDDFVQLLCLRANISPCGSVGHRNAKHFRPSTQDCPAADAGALRMAVQSFAAADVRLHKLATRRFQADWERRHQPQWPQPQRARPFPSGARAGGGSGSSISPLSGSREPTTTLFEEDRLVP
jgi:hypothetical protein